ncbi:MAG: AraC family transcriptional regulator [Fermentimonas sp.]|mgnify:CR=1 FL=1|nr:AraC family transcriptional regulator [Fermentimonas sp.]MDD4285215.1 AraC family transcriptional regulator [Fermentimonas sp.]MDD4723934.1 AraC family transcriptional regulator [Fermentimonas sp.]HBT85210.1 AraC family transcriptional regulator [Porphyromonadaceae bacterium]
MTYRLMHENLNLDNGSPVKIKWCDYDYFKFPLHFHNEYEIVYILKSSGTRFVGNSIQQYSDGDLVLLGSSLQHMYRSDPEYYTGRDDLRVNAITLQFSKDFFGHSINNYPELNNIKKLLMKSKRGVYFHKNANKRIRTRMEKALELSGLPLLLECINILSLMSVSHNVTLLNREDSESTVELIEADTRLVKILSFIKREYYRHLSIDEIAAVAGMNKSAFCRFFHAKTGKTCTEYITSLRINYACKLLLEGRLTISEICYECGFNNISNFNRHFKRITNYSPTKYLLEFNKPPLHNQNFI